MKLAINGETVDAPQLSTVADLAHWLELPSFGSAVELNGAVVRKADHASTQLAENDRLEIVRLVGGG
jgi:thiamine biosynthesis protein ThiS